MSGLPMNNSSLHQQAHLINNAALLFAINQQTCRLLTIKKSIQLHITKGHLWHVSNKWQCRGCNKKKIGHDGGEVIKLTRTIIFIIADVIKIVLKKKF